MFNEPMEVTVNQQNYLIPDSCNVSCLLLDVLKQPNKGLAVAINQIVIPKADWDIQYLQAGDHIVIIKAAQGG